MPIFILQASSSLSTFSCSSPRPDLVICSGAHNFCLAHLREWISRNLPNPECPTCRDPIQRDVTKLRVNVALRDAIAARQRASRPKPVEPQTVVIPWAEIRFEKDEDGERVELGRGAFGSVYAADYSFMKVAVKVRTQPTCSGNSKLLMICLCAYIHVRHSDIPLLSSQVLALGGSTGPAVTAALRREASLQSSLAHEHIVRVFGLAEGAGGKFGLVMARMHTDLQVRS